MCFNFLWGTAGCIWPRTLERACTIPAAAAEASKNSLRAFLRACQGRPCIRSAPSKGVRMQLDHVDDNQLANSFMCFRRGQIIPNAHISVLSNENGGSLVLKKIPNAHI